MRKVVILAVLVAIFMVATKPQPIFCVRHISSIMLQEVEQSCRDKWQSCIPYLPGNRCCDPYHCAPSPSISFFMCYPNPFGDAA